MYRDTYVRSLWEGYWNGDVIDVPELFEEVFKLPFGLLLLRVRRREPAHRLSGNRLRLQGDRVHLDAHRGHEVTGGESN